MKIIEENYDELTHLPTDLILPWLFVKDVVSFRERKITAFLPTDSQRMEYLLDDIIMSSLQANVTMKFNPLSRIIFFTI